jgi:hypothetical protein
MCDCYDYEIDEQTVESDAKQPEKVPVPIQVVRAKK